MLGAITAGTIGVNAITLGTGNVLVDNPGAITAGTYGIWAQATNNTGTGTVTVNTNRNIDTKASVTGLQGIHAETTSTTGNAPGDVTVHVTAGTISGKTDGIEAFVNSGGNLVGGNVLVTTDAGSQVGGQSATGIHAHTNGAGSVTVTANGAIKDPANGLQGINAEINNVNNTQAVQVTTTNVVWGGGAATGATGLTTLANTTDGTGQGIRAFTSGLGSVRVDANAGSQIRSEVDHGILAYTDNGSNASAITVNTGAGVTISAPGGNADGIHAATPGTGSVNVTVGPGTLIGGANSDPVTGLNDVSAVGHDGINAVQFHGGLTNGNVNVTLSDSASLATGTKITASNIGIAAYSVPVVGTAGFTNTSITVNAGANNTITALNGHGIDAEIGGPQGSVVEPNTPVLFNTGNVTVNVGANTVINANSATADGIHVVDNSLLGSSAQLHVTVDPTAVINAGHSSVFMQASQGNTQTVIYDTGSNGTVHMNANTGDTGGSGVDAHTFGSGGVIVNVGSAACANNVANCKITVATGVANQAGDGILAYTTNANGSVTVNNFAVIDPGIDGIHAEITNAANSSPVSVTSNADVSGSRTGIFAGTVGLGSVNVTVGNSIGGTTTLGGSNGIYAVANNSSNASGVTVNVNGNVTGNGDPLVSGSITNPLYSEVSTAQPGPYTPANAVTNYPNVTGYGVFARTAGTGNVTVHADGTGTITANTAGDMVGISASTTNTGNSGDILVSSNEAIVAGNIGIQATTPGSGKVTVTTTANGTINTAAGTGAGTSGIGIDATITKAGSTAAILVNAQGNITSGNIGINAVHSGSGDVSVTTAGTVDATANNAGPAIAATTNGSGKITVATGPGSVTSGAGWVSVFGSTGSGNVNVNSGGDVSGGVGIRMLTGGSGTMDITTGAGTTVTGTVAEGIGANTVNGNIAVAANGAVNGATRGIDAQATGNGLVTVGGAGLVTGTTAGIFERSGATAAGDVLTVNGSGGTTATGVGGIAIDAALGAGQAGNIVINRTGAITAANGTDIIATTLGTGTVNVTTGPAPLNGGTGVIASSTSGKVTIVANGPITATAAGGDTMTGEDITTLTDTSVGDAINVRTTTGDISVTTGTGLISSNADAVDVRSAGGGTVDVTIGTGGATGAPGVIAIGGPVTVTTNGAVSDAVFHAITAASLTGGNVTVTNNGTVNGGAGFDGIFATTTGGAGTGNVIVNSNNTVTGGLHGIHAFTPGTGNVTVDSHSTVVTSTTGSGILATATSGVVTVGAGAVNGGTNGVEATTSGGGNVFVTTFGPVTAGGAAGNTGILGRSTAGNGSVQVITGGTVTGATGINGSAVGTGTVSVATASGPGGNVTASAGPGITTSVANGNSTVNANAALVSGTTYGVDSVSTGTGVVTVTGPANITSTGGGSLAGIRARETGAGPGAGNDGIVISGTGNTSSTAGAGIIASIGAGNASNINITRSGTVSGATDGVNAATLGTGNVTVSGTGNTTGTAGTGIIASSQGGNVRVTPAGTVSGVTGINANTILGGSVTVITANGPAGNVTGTGGSGIVTNTAAGTNSVLVTSNTAVTGSGAGNSGISAGTGAGGAITVTIDPLATVTSTLGRGVSLSATGSGTATLINAGTVTGAGTAANPHISIATGTGLTTVNNLLSGTIGVSGSAGLLALNGVGGPVTVNNDGSIFGRATLAGGPVTFNNNGTGLWVTTGTNSLSSSADTLTNAPGGVISFAGTSTSLAFGAGADAFTNRGVVNGRSTAGVTVTGLEALNNQPGGGGGGGVINVGNNGAPGSLTEFMSFASDAGSAQTVTNAGTFNIYGRGAVPGALNFTGGGAGTTSNFNNTGGLIDLQVDGSAVTNAVTLNTTALGGTSDLNYTYTFAPGTYNFNGGNNSRLAVDTFLGAPGSTSDRLVVGGNVTGTTLVKVNDTNAGAGALNLKGITVVAVQGSGSTAFKVDPTSLNYVNFGPLGAINKGFFVDPLIYVPGGATGLGNPNGNAYKFFGVPGPFAFNMPIAHTAAQNIFSETALLWEDRQSELRSMHARGISISRFANGGGADLPTKAPVAIVPQPSNEIGVWLKAIGSWTNRTATTDYGQLNPALSGLNLSNSYHQNIYGLIGGVDFGKSNVTSPKDSFVGEIMAGYINSSVNFDQPNALGNVASTTTKFGYNGGTVGLSGTYMNGGFFVSALVKADFLNLDISGIPGAFCATGGTGSCSNSVRSTTWGVLGDVGYRFDYGRYFFEPLATLLYSQSHVGDLNLPGAGVTVQFGKADTFRIAGGLRAGGTVAGDQQRYLEASVTGRVWDQVSGNNTVAFANVGTPFSLADTYAKAFVETDIQLDWINRGPGWSAFVKAGAKFNDEFFTGTAKGGARYQW